MAKASGNGKTRTIPPQFKIGDFVRWEVVARGLKYTKKGKIVRLVKAGQSPMTLPGKFLFKFTSRLGNAGTRDHKTYLVAVEHDGTGKDLLYWPRAEKLHLLGSKMVKGRTKTKSRTSPPQARV